MKLIGNYTSPFVRKISIILLEKGITFEFVNASPWEADSPVGQFNPLGKVPALIDGDDSWFDSAIIADYLELHNTTPPLLPADRLQALKVRQLALVADGVAEAALLIVREQMRPDAAQSAEQLARQREKILRGLDRLEQAAGAGQGLNGEAITLADIATVCALGYLNFRRVAPGWCASRPQLVRLAEKMLLRDSVARTAPSAT
ncbi:glutathione S-transferase [Pantoea sp. 1.19]|uniref:glutathione S-transferase n=1 Tax=Pantoea sp. 1.19 TaxID=1925589 RepID=UPI000948A1CC|nr:glutathione S-transferase [Pantoea sp. 1.19]